MNSNYLCLLLFRSNIEYELVLIGPVCITLHSEALNFNCYLSDHSIRWSMSLLSSWWQTAEEACSLQIEIIMLIYLLANLL